MRSNDLVDVVDESIIDAVHTLGLSIIDGGDGLQNAGQVAKADAYRRVGKMLLGIANQKRDPLLKALWKHTGGGNNRFSSADEATRRETATAAVYALLKYDQIKTRAACKIVAEATGEDSEQLRERFKGLGHGVNKYNDTEAAKTTRRILDNMQRLFPETPDDWKFTYNILIQMASGLTKEILQEKRRLRSIRENGGKVQG